MRLAAASAPPSVDLVHDLLARFWRSRPDVGEDDRMRFETAVVEVVGNVVDHGGASRLEVSLSAADGQLRADVLDDGLPVSDDVPARIEDAAMPEDPLAETGRGMAIATALVDEVGYRRDGAENRWWVVRSLGGA